MVKAEVSKHPTTGLRSRPDGQVVVVTTRYSFFLLDPWEESYGTKRSDFVEIELRDGARSCDWLQSINVKKGILFIGTDKGTVECWVQKSDNNSFSMGHYTVLHHQKAIDSGFQPVTPGRWPLSPRIRAVSCSILHENVVATAENRRIHLWDVESIAKLETSIKTISNPTNTHALQSEPILDLAWHPTNSKEIAVADGSSSIFIEDFSSSERLGIVQKNAHSGGAVNSVRWLQSAGENALVSCGVDGLVKIWDIRSFQNAVCTIKSHIGVATCLEIGNTESEGSDHALIGTGGSDGRIRLWNVSGNINKNLDIDMNKAWNPDCLIRAEDSYEKFGNLASGQDESSSSLSLDFSNPYSSITGISLFGGMVMAVNRDGFVFAET